jgi:hypothetical protein
MIVAAVILTWFSASWLVWTVLMVVMLFTFGRHHPRTFDEDVPLDSPPQVAGTLCRRDVPALFHARADRAAAADSVNESWSNAVVASGL